MQHLFKKISKLFPTTTYLEKQNKLRYKKEKKKKMK